ncbi:ATP-binding protein [Pollutibacter soli]|uniref:ATP-binding protein n=1 Tax=Pollutibacter soli TaxID=3034157 RepID=UPI003013BA61
MKITDFVPICPYPGLRSFTEDESIYFKGRDQQVDQITALLEQNKFLMVSGASGEGKSSLIYGGLVPNARAGFFKAKYSNWAIASFRPERNPVHNLALSLAEKLNLNPVTVETELRRGYSSLIDLYTQSACYPAAESGDAQITEKDSKEKQRHAANLMIIADQFEEFFTNPENFYNDVPSTDAQIVVNLMLESARIAIKRNLPVFIVCTMRSDYIGQCSAFRGLPEYIGFSQFFVPRLKRMDLKEVIEEPALLSGNRISQRLIERLVFDMADGVDQLPILQHALNQVWLAADRGQDQMDLIHYAMVGGMPPEDLPDEDFNRFQQWFNRLPEAHKQFYNQTGLSRVIDIHANLLYENAASIYNSQGTGVPLSDEEVKRIISTTFTGLTKIDNSRAVRNRMTLAEITGLINVPKITTTIIGKVINIFREEGNSFIHPFKTLDPASFELEPETVLDITHESLIRNWDKLEIWANKEFESYSIWLDFRKQFDRWKQSGQKSGYLLPIGPLTFFENWYAESKPNLAWIMRYAGVSETREKKERDASKLLTEADLFLKKSASKEIFARTFMKYGVRRIATLLAIFIMLVLTGFYWYNADEKKNGNVLDRVRSESGKLLSSQEVTVFNKGLYLISEERFEEGAIMKYLKTLNKRDQLQMAAQVYGLLVNLRKHDTSVLVGNLFTLTSDLLLSKEYDFAPEFRVTQGNEFMIRLAMDEYYNPGAVKREKLRAIADKGYELALQFYQHTELFRPTISTELNLIVHYWLTFGSVSVEKINHLLGAISPAENEAARKAFNIYYPKGAFEPGGRQSFDFNGGYHTLASMYAAAGNIEKTEWCFQQLLDNNQRPYFELPRVLNNHLNVLGYLYQYRHNALIPRFLNWIAIHTEDNPPITLVRNAVIRSGYITHLYWINIQKNFYRSIRGYIYPNLYFSERYVYDAMMHDYDSLIQKIPDADERNFEEAMNYKRKAIFEYKYRGDRKMPLDSVQLDDWLAKSFASFALVSQAYKEGTESTTLIYNSDGFRTGQQSRESLFLYPDYRDGWFAWTYHGDYLFNYLLRKNLLSGYFRNGNDLKLLHLWVTKAFEVQPQLSRSLYSNNFKLPDTAMKSILMYVSQHPNGNEFDKNLLLLVLSSRSFDRGDTTSGLKYFSQIDVQTLRQSSDRYEYLEKGFIYNQMKYLAANLGKAGHIKDAVVVAELFPGNMEKVIVYSAMTEALYQRNANPEAFIFADSAWAKMLKADFSNSIGLLDSRPDLIRVLSEIGSKRINMASAEVLRDIPEQNKLRGILAQIQGITLEGNYYRALTSIPNTLTESQDLQCRTEIMMGASRAKEKQNNNKRWEEVDNALLHNYHHTDFLPN